MTRPARHDKARVAVVGLGTIGKRVVDAISLQPDMELAGILVRKPTPNVLYAQQYQAPLYCQEPAATADLQQHGFPVRGDLDALIAAADIVIDCAARGQAASRAPIYRAAAKPFVVQGGEKHDITGFTYSSFVNFSGLPARPGARIGSCNTTGMTRVLSSLDRFFGVEAVQAVIIRCAADPDKENKGIANGAVVTPGLSHHGRDVALLLPHIPIRSQALTVPMNHGHVITLAIRLKKPVEHDKVCQLLSALPRIRLADEADGLSTPELAEAAARCGHRRGDRHAVTIWRSSIVVEGRSLFLHMAIHMESIVVPETVDCIRGLLGLSGRAGQAMWLTDQALGIQADQTSYAMF